MKRLISCDKPTIALLADKLTRMWSTSAYSVNRTPLCGRHEA
jgi:hypothetical protein